MTMMKYFMMTALFLVAMAFTDLSSVVRAHTLRTSEDSPPEVERMTQFEKMKSACANGDKGPFDECVGMSGENCCAFVQSCAPEVSCKILHPGEPMMRNLDMNRVYIIVDGEDELVVKVPYRG